VVAGLAAGFVLGAAAPAQASVFDAVATAWAGFGLDDVTGAAVLAVLGTVGYRWLTGLRTGARQVRAALADLRAASRDLRRAEAAAAQVEVAAARR
jgi:hypothetical protein